MENSLDRLRYGAGQAARVSWFFGQKLVAARLAKPVKLPHELRARSMPDRRRILADLRALLVQDWRNIEAGIYAAPETGNPIAGLRRAVDFFADLPAVDKRRQGGSRDDRRLDAVPPGRYPPYYLQKFHFQSDGYLSEASAERYDHQVEVLFGGGAAAMRRQALVPLRRALAGMGDGGSGQARLLDLACGTGGWLREIKLNHPRLKVTGVDLSRPYLDLARRRLDSWSRASFVEGNAEALPFADAAFDVVTCVYLFHELPPGARRAVAAEIGRVLRPGGTVILVDSLQTGDVPDYDGMLAAFPLAFHEPYYESYLKTDLDRMFGPGFRAGERFPAYLSKIASWRRLEQPGSEATHHI